MKIKTLNNNKIPSKMKLYRGLPYVVALSLFIGSPIDSMAKENTIVKNKVTTEWYNTSDPEGISHIEYEELDDFFPIEDRKLIAFTFDDGPGKYTERLVKTLNFYGAQATFFLVGANINNYSDAVVNTYCTGHEIAIHSYSHKSFTKMSINDIQDEIDKTKELLEEIDVVPSNLVRPPYGSINKNVEENIDSSFIIWSVDTRDWESRNKDKVKEEVLKGIKEGDIVLFHDIHESTVDAIEELLPELCEEYEFVSVSELFRRNSQKLEENKKYYKVNKQ